MHARAPAVRILISHQSLSTFEVASRLPSTVSHFKTERGNSLEMLQRARASYCDDEGNTWFFLSCGGILELRRGIQASCSTGPGKSSFHSNCELELGIALDVGHIILPFCNEETPSRFSGRLYSTVCSGKTWIFQLLIQDSFYNIRPVLFVFFLVLFLELKVVF